MAQTLPERPELITPASGDWIHTVDISDTTDSPEGTSKKISRTNWMPNWTEVKGKPTIFPTNWTNVADKPTSFPPSAHTHTFASLTSKPTTISGYGITDAFTQAQSNSNFIRTNANSTKTAGLTRYNNNLRLYFGTSNGMSLFSSGTQNYVDLTAGDFIVRDGSTTRHTLGKNGNLAVYGLGTFGGSVTAAAFYEGSDKSLKKNITSIGGGFYSYTLKSDPEQILRYGVIADYLERDNPELVSKNKKGIRSVNYNGLYSLRISELMNDVDLLKIAVKDLLNK